MELTIFALQFVEIFPLKNFALLYNIEAFSQNAWSSNLSKPHLIKYLCYMVSNPTTNMPN